VTRRLLIVTIAIAAVLAVTVAGLGSVAAADPTVDCAGSGGGAMFVADSNFTVAHNGSAVTYNQSTFPDDETIRLRNVTLSSNASTFLRLENGTGATTCVANVSATNDSILVAPDGEGNASVDGNVSTLSLGDVGYGSGGVDLAYDATESWTLTLHDTGLGSGTDVEAVDGGGNPLAAGTTNGDDAVAFSMPAGTNDVDVREVTGSGSGGGGSGGGGGGYAPPPSSDPSPDFSIASVDLGTAETTVGESVTVDVQVDNDGDADGEYTATLTADGESLDSETVEVNSNWHETFSLSAAFDEPGTYQLAVDGASAGTVTVTGEPDLAITGSSLGASSASSGETVTITATVENRGSADGEMTVPLLVDGEQIAEKTASVGAGAETTVTFEHTFEEPGTETVTVAGETVGTVDVSEQSAQSDDSDDGDGGGGGPPLVIVGGLALLLAGGTIGGYYWHDPEQFEELLNR